ncbi:SDR family NAD(P)-dependent oxidoreductase [Parapedobacter deserti]|uniref:SDR family NAD(P)-dependent oxidoreductase n=1 Tax=Parapedobacter deserti TaxID=1912957 RepID=A0ABV7JNT1_9SPHI
MKSIKKVMMITGGTHGIGAATARHMAKQGIDLVLVARNSSPDFVDELHQLGSEVLVFEADLTNESACAEAVASAQHRFGRIDALVHLAGGAVPGGLLDVSTEAWHHAFDIHLHAAFHLCRFVVPLLKKSDDGCVILVSSAAGIRGVKNALAYAVVKGALPQMARALACELADQSIRVNCVSPGVIRTRFQEMLTPEQIKNNIDNRIPLHREGTPDDVAKVIAMLMENTYITGENIVVDGGLTMRIA